MPYLEAIGIEQRFGAFIALSKVDFTAEKGEFVTLLGPSGCGKTTLLNIIAGFITPTSGALFVAGKDVSHISPEGRDSAMCFQSYALFPHLTVRENVSFGPRQKKVARDETERRVKALIDKIGLEIHKDKLPNALSGGQQQRVALARALAVQPGLVLFDEPLSNLDAKLRDQVRIEIRSLQRELGFTAVYVTHDQSEALAMSDKVLLLSNGVVEQAGAPKDIYFRPRTRFVADFIGAANIHDTPKTPFGTIPTDHDGPICWRPETARLEGGDIALSGTISAIAFQGAFTDVFVAQGGETVRLQLPGGFDGEPGSALRFTLPNSAILPLEG